MQVKKPLNSSGGLPEGLRTSGFSLSPEKMHWNEIILSVKTWEHSLFSVYSLPFEPHPFSMTDKGKHGRPILTFPGIIFVSISVKKAIHA